MTPAERKTPDIINGQRRKRIANGSGTDIQQVNQLLKQFDEMRKMMKSIGKLQGAGRSLKGLPFGR
jgi:signal recognition particle subunit SRP54